MLAPFSAPAPSLVPAPKDLGFGPPNRRPVLEEAGAPSPHQAMGDRLAAVVWGGDIYTSADYGRSWTHHPAAGTRGWQSIASSSDGSKLVAVEQNGGVYISDDYGTSWEARSEGDDADPDIAEVKPGAPSPLRRMGTNLLQWCMEVVFTLGSSNRALSAIDLRNSGGRQRGQ